MYAWIVYSASATIVTNYQSVLYLTMRFAKTIRQIQGLQAYHAGDKLNVEVSHDNRQVVVGWG